MLRKLTVIWLISMMCLLGAIPVLAQSQYSTLGEYEKATGETIKTFNEAPMLRTKVAAGEIQPLEERISEEPMVIKPLEEIGQYGGTAHVFSIQANHPGDGAYVGQGFETVLRLTPDCKEIVPNIAKKWKLSKDGKVLTLYLRKGMKWSDGVPFTADDVMFWWKDMILNDELTPVKPTTWWGPGGELMKVERIDDYTVRFRFAVPYPIAPRLLAGPEGLGKFQYPKHYLKRFHINYNPKANDLAKERGFNSWYEYFTERNSTWCSMVTNPDLPTTGPFKCVESRPGYLLYERNPYYWKVDTEGNQLPYIDKIITRKVENIEMYNAKIIGGESDFAARSASLENYPLYKESAKEGNYRVNLWTSGYGSVVIYQANQTCKDPVLRKIFRDVRFRRALSLAINREEINEFLFFGLGVPRQWTLISDSVLYEPRFGDAYAQYDPDEANRLLGEMDLKWDKNHEYRLRPDGKKLAWTLEYFPGAGMAAAKTAMSELVKGYWKKIGCKIGLKETTGELTNVRAPANDIAMNLWHGDRGTDMAFFTGDIRWFVPQSIGWEMSYGVEWARWHTTRGESGEEPPEKVKKIYEWLGKMTTTLDEEERIQLGKKILASQAENIWTIGTVGMVSVPVITRNNLRNVPEKHLYTWDVLYTKDSYPEQFFFEQK